MSVTDKKSKRGEFTNDSDFFDFDDFVNTYSKGARPKSRNKKAKISVPARPDGHPDAALKRQDTPDFSYDFAEIPDVLAEDFRPQVSENISCYKDEPISVSVPKAAPEEIKPVPEPEFITVKAEPELKTQEVKSAPEPDFVSAKAESEQKPQEVKPAPKLEFVPAKAEPEPKTQEVKFAPESEFIPAKAEPEPKTQEVKSAPEPEFVSAKAEPEPKTQEVKSAPEPEFVSAKVEPEPKPQEVKPAPKPEFVSAKAEPELQEVKYQSKSGTIAETKTKTRSDSRSRKRDKKLPVINMEEQGDSRESIMKVLGYALDEDISELEQISDSYGAAQIKSENRLKPFLIGLMFTLLALVGLIATFKGIAAFVAGLSDNTKQKAELEKFLLPIVMTDPAEFDDSNRLSDQTMLLASIWDIVIYGDIEKYTRDASGNNMYVPAIDAEMHAADLFGSGLTFIHQTLGSSELRFYYDAETKMYTVPVNPSTSSYTPSVEKVNVSGEVYTVTVGYQSARPSWKMEDESYTPQIVKYMNYTIIKRSGDYTLTGISSYHSAETEKK